jgi:hypothetical protein
VATVLARGALFDGRVDAAGGPAEVLVDDDRIVEVGESVGMPGDPATDITATARAGLVMAGRVHRRQGVMAAPAPKDPSP